MAFKTTSLVEVECDNCAALITAEVVSPSETSEETQVDVWLAERHWHVDAEGGATLCPKCS